MRPIITTKRDRSPWVMFFSVDSIFFISFIYRFFNFATKKIVIISKIKKNRMKKLSHSFAKVSHSYKKGVALVGMRHLKTAL